MRLSGSQPSVDLDAHGPAWELAAVDGHPEVTLAVVRIEATTANAFTVAQEIFALVTAQQKKADTDNIPLRITVA